jgi:hypothetical protein
MAGRWIKRRQHIRRLRSDKIVLVRAYEFFHTAAKEKQADQHLSICPHCKAEIFTIPMPKGGWGHFDGEARRVEHACFRRGAHLSKRRDLMTPDMFENDMNEDQEAPPPQTPPRASGGGASD